MNYKIIADLDLFLDFVNWLPDLGPSEQFMVNLFARKKYLSVLHSSADKNQLRRFTCIKENIENKVRQLEVPLGTHLSRGGPIPQEALALYITPNPRDLWKATLKGVSALAKSISNQEFTANPHQTMLTTIHQCAGKKKYSIFDLDSKDLNVLNQAVEICEGKCDVIETRGGFHILVLHAEQILNKKWYPEIANLSNVDVKGDIQVPVVGCYQGGFIPNFYRKYKS